MIDVTVTHVGGTRKGMRELKDKLGEMADWLKDRGYHVDAMSQYDYPDGTVSKVLITYSFNNASDAMMFKLTWGGK